MAKTISKHIAVILTLFSVIFFLGACGPSETAPEDRVYLEDSEIDAALSDGDSYKGKWIRVVGKVFNIDKDGENYAVQAWHSAEDAEQPFIVYIAGDKVDSIETDDFFLVDGEITGTFSGENAFGGEVTNMMIEADTITVGSYDEIYAPAESTKEVGETKEQHGVKLTVDRVEYAKDEARVYLSVSNESGYTASVYNYNAKAIQDGAQFEHQDNYEAGYDGDLGEILDGAGKEGIVRFRGLDPEKGFKLIIEAYSDNYDIEMEDFVFEIK